MKIQCAKCGKWIEQDDARTITKKDLTEEHVCETCFEDMWEDSIITHCISCGEWVYLDAVKSVQVYDQRDVFDRCPCCGNDILTGMTLDETKEEAKYSDEIMMRLRQRNGLDAKDTSMDDEIMKMSPKEIFEELLAWEGIFGYSQYILGWVNELFR